MQGTVRAISGMCASAVLANGLLIIPVLNIFRRNISKRHRTEIGGQVPGDCADVFGSAAFFDSAPISLMPVFYPTRPVSIKCDMFNRITCLPLHGRLPRSCLYLQVDSIKVTGCSGFPFCGIREYFGDAFGVYGGVVDSDVVGAAVAFVGED